MQAVMLAAGMGKRLGKFTKNNTKCMLEIQGKTLIERATEALLEAGIRRFVIVVGYNGENLKNYLTKECKNPKIKDMEFVFIDNDVFDKTNNIYSLFLAKEELIKDDTILLESDLIYDYSLIKRLVECNDQNVVSVAKYKQWMDGTVIKVNENGTITEFVEKKDFDYKLVDEYYKTVNVYKFSKDFLNKTFIPFLDAYIKAYGENEYYELVLKIIAHLSRTELKVLEVSDVDWYEIEDAQDLDIANCMFSSGVEKLANYQKRYGGYWRFENLIDYCYLVNPYYPSKKMLDKINYFSKKLITQYPSGQNIQCINASRLFNDVDEKYFCVGNGAAELINVLGRILSGKMYVSKCAFNEYIRCFEKCEMNIYDMALNDYQFNVKEILGNIEHNDIICIVNPDNPTGSFINKKDMLTIVEKCTKLNKILIFDESFIDFASENERYTLIDNEILENNKNLIVIKSISKSYGIPGIRLGVLACGNQELLQKIKQYISVWNINSYGEYFLQIGNLYKKDYVTSCNKIAEVRQKFIDELRKNSKIKVYESQANYLLCYLGEYDSTDIALKLLEKNILIKDLKTKSAFKDMNYIRLAIRTEEENQQLIEELNKLIK